MSSENQSLVGPSDIAELAGVSRGAVSNWRNPNRRSDFPQPVAGTDTNPLFSLEEVSAWLRHRGYKVTTGRGAASAWAAMNALRGDVHPEDAAVLILALACVRRADPGAWNLRVRQHPDDAVEWLRYVAESAGLRDLVRGSLLDLERISRSSVKLLLGVIDNLADDQVADVTDALLERAARAQVKRGVESGYVGSPVSQMLVSLALRHPESSAVYDPACGIGVALTEIGRQAPGPLTLVGQEINYDAASIAKQRAFLRGIEMAVLTGDTLSHDQAPDFRADVVVAEPPFGVRFDAPWALADPRFTFGLPPKSSADLAWVQHCIAHLAEAGVAYVVTPHGPLFRSGADRAIRVELLRRGCVRAIVGLPGKLHPHTAIPLAVWVVQRPNAMQQSVLLIDGAGMPGAQRRVAAWLSGEVDDIEAPHRVVDVAELLARDATLDPRQYVEREEAAPKNIVDSLRTSAAAGEAALASGAAALRALSEPLSAAPVRVVTVGDLLQQGAARMSVGRVGPSEAGDNDGDAPVVTARDVRSGVLPDTTANRDLDDELTQPGDVLVVTWNRISATVDPVGGRRIGTGVNRLRVTNPALVLPEYLAAVLSGSWNDRFFGGATIHRAHLKELEVPLVSLGAQQDLARRFAQARALSARAAELVDSAGRIEDALREAVRYGVPLPGGSEATMGRGRADGATRAEKEDR